MKTIVFAGTFYTLWDVECERINIALGASYNKVTCTYYKNLSKDLNEAIIKAGTNNVDETLKGKRKSFQYKTPIKLEPRLMTEVESLFRIILVNQPENLIEGVRESAFERSLELGYLTKQDVYWSYNRYSDGALVESKTAYKWNALLRSEDQWMSSTLNRFFIGII